MKQIVDTHSVARTFETENNSAENIKKEICKYIDEMSGRLLGYPNNENFQIFELTIKRYEDKLESPGSDWFNGVNLVYTPELESYKKPKKEYSIEIIANVIRNDPDQYFLIVLSVVFGLQIFLFIYLFNDFETL